MKNIKSQPIIYGLDEVSGVADKLLTLLPSCAVMTFAGPLGAGKTSIIRELLHRCGVSEPVTSPTFTYVNIYVNSSGNRFYHFDLYRIGTLDAFCQAGFDEYLYQPKSWAFIEWPELIMPILDHSVCQVRIEYEAEKRVLVVT